MPKRRFAVVPVSEFQEMAAVKEFWSRVVKGESCWEWAGAHEPKGYGVLWFQRGHGAKTRSRVKILAHRVSFYLHTGQDSDLDVLHKCDNKLCVRPDHLYLGTAVENMRDCSVRVVRRTGKLNYEK